MKFHRLKKALFISAFFIACILSSYTYAQPSLNCPSFKPTESANIRYIHDGDTLFLSDNRKVRLIGIDTPELAHHKKNRTEQPFAREARDYARHLIKKHGSHVKLMSGIENHDRYKRNLFHIQLSDGSLLQNRLLKAGLAVALTTPPNQLLSTCYQAAEQSAQTQHHKIWSLAKYQTITVDKLSPGMKGFRIIRGKVRYIGESKKAFWLNFHGNFSTRIDKRDLMFFKHPLKHFVDREITVRGWLRFYKNKPQMSLRHPSSIRMHSQ